MLAYRLRRWTNIKLTLSECLVLAAMGILIGYEQILFSDGIQEGAHGSPLP